MARYDQLPVYKASYDLLVTIFKLARHFKKEIKYTVGEKLKAETVEMITNIYRANSREHKKPLIGKARENIEVIRLYMRLLKDLQQINLAHFVEVNQLIESVSKQLVGWQKAMAK